MLILLSLGLLTTACFGSSETVVETPRGLFTELMVKAPEAPLPLNTPVVVKSRTGDSSHGVSHVELYAVELPSGEADVLIRSDPAAFGQTSFTIDQIFVPRQPGHYVIKVKGYNRQGESTESDYIGFDVE